MTTTRITLKLGDVILFLVLQSLVFVLVAVAVILLSCAVADSLCQDMAPPIAAATACEEAVESVDSQVTPDTATRTTPNLELLPETTVPAEESAIPCVSQILGVDFQGQETGVELGHPPMSVAGPAVLSLWEPEDPGTQYVDILPAGREVTVTLPGRIWVYPSSCPEVAVRDGVYRVKQLMETKKYAMVVLGSPPRW